MATKQVKLQKKYIGRKVIMADGSRSTIARVLATCFKTADGVSLKTIDLTELGSGTLKQIAEKEPAAKKAPAKKPAAKKPVKETTNRRSRKVEDDEDETPSRATRRGTAATTRRGSSASGRGRRPNTDVLDDYSEATRRACQNYLKNVAGMYESMDEMADLSLQQLRDKCMKHLNKKTKPASKPAATSNKVSSGKKPAKKPESIVAKAKAKLQASIQKTQTLKKTADKITRVAERDTVAFSEFDEKIVSAIRSKLTQHIGPLIRKQTGYDVSVAITYAMWNDNRCTVQIGIMPTDATDKELANYAKTITTLNREEEGTIVPTSETEFDDDLGEFGDKEDDEVAEVEEFDSEEVKDIPTLVKDLSKQIGRKDKRLTTFVTDWLEDPIIEETFGEDVKIGTELINSSGNVAIVCGYKVESERVALYDTADEKFTFAKLIAVAKMDYAEDVAEQEEEEEEEELEEELEVTEEDEESFDD